MEPTLPTDETKEPERAHFEVTAKGLRCTQCGVDGIAMDGDEPREHYEAHP